MPSRNSQPKCTAANQKNHPSTRKKSTKGQRLEAMARKKDERAVRRKEKKAAGNGDEKSFMEQLALIGLMIRDVIGDGNCLFRALGDQLDGDDHAHMRHRQDVVRYITEHRADFEPFIEDDVPFDKHIQNLAVDGTYAGNDSIVAFARLHKVTIVIHQLGSPAWEVHGEKELAPGSSSSKVRQLHISYHNGDHYASVRCIDDNSDGPANVRIEPARPLPPTPPSAKKQKTKDENVVQSQNLIADDESVMEPIVDGEGQGSGCDLSNKHFIDRVMEYTRCRNRELVAELCADADFFDINAVCDNVLMFMEGVLSASSSSAPSDGEVVTEPHGATCAKPKSQQGGTVNRRQRKQEKKARAALRHKTAAGAIGRHLSSDEDESVPFVITQNLKVLQI